MSPRKLSETDKSDILNLYRHPEETTSTLAVRYGVSNSTISRILKSNLLESEYEELIQQKRLNRTPSGASSSTVQALDLPVHSEVESSPILQAPTPSAVEPETVEPESQTFASTSADGRRRRRRSSTPLSSETEEKAIQTELPLNLAVDREEDEPDETDELLDESDDRVETSGFEELLNGDLMDLDDEDDDLDDDLDDDWEDDAGEIEGRKLIKASLTGGSVNVQVLPLSEASLPKTCYLVVDRAAELIARPLREFSDLGQIPAEEVQEKTLPIFDNHKVARRFSNRSQRVIKVPDSRMLQKARFHLQAKGITRLLIDGQVYSLLPTQP